MRGCRDGNGCRKLLVYCDEKREDRGQTFVAKRKLTQMRAASRQNAINKIKMNT
jgi:hypothetical protein